MWSGKLPATSLEGLPLPGYDGLHPGDWMFGPDQRLRLVELRGDWKYHVQAFRLRSHFTSSALCHACQAAKVATLGPSCIEFTRNPAWLQTIRTQRQFMLQELQEPINGLVFCAGFHYSMIRWCSMHTVNSGVGLFANGGCFFELLKVGWWQGSKDEQFRKAYRSFREFVNRNRIETSQPVFKPWMFVATGEEFCYFGSKATRNDDLSVVVPILRYI